VPTLPLVGALSISVFPGYFEMLQTACALIQKKMQLLGITDVPQT
jgi:hypothetical protein